MDLKKEETAKLELAKQMFKIHNLTKQQAEFTLGRKLTDNTELTWLQKVESIGLQLNICLQILKKLRTKAQKSHSSLSQILLSTLQEKPKDVNL